MLSCCLYHSDNHGVGALGPQPRFIHIRQSFRIQYTCFELDAVNIDWWICIHFCLAAWGPQTAKAPSPKTKQRNHSCHILPFQPILWNRCFPPEPARTAQSSPESISAGGRIWQVGNTDHFPRQYSYRLEIGSMGTLGCASKISTTKTKNTRAPPV